MGKKNQTWKVKSQIWKICQMSLVMTANGTSVKSNPLTWVRSNAKPTNVCFTVWKVSWSKATEKQNVKRTRKANGVSTRNSVLVSSAVKTAQKLRCQKCQRSQKMKKNQKTRKKTLKTKRRSPKTKKRSQKTKKWKIQKKLFPEMMENGQNVNQNQLKMVKSHARVLSVLFSVWRVSK